jgi:DNA-binding SARP family transcriptional activator
MDFLILGPLWVNGGDELLALDRHRRETRILGALLLAANRTVPVADLVDMLWPSAPPTTAREQVQNCASALRRRIARAGLPPLRTLAGGYRLDVAAEQLDACVFERCLVDSRQALRAKDLPVAAAKLGEALGLWRGDVLAGTVLGGSFEAATARLHELRLAAEEDHFEVAVEMGVAATVLSDLFARAHENPLRERLIAVLMRALAECGRRAEAIDVFHATRLSLANSYGVEPGPVMNLAYSKIIAHPYGACLDLRAISPSAETGAATVAEALHAALSQLDQVRRELEQVLATVPHLS